MFLRKYEGWVASALRSELAAGRRDDVLGVHVVFKELIIDRLLAVRSTDDDPVDRDRFCGAQAEATADGLLLGRHRRDLRARGGVHQGGLGRGVGMVRASGGITHLVNFTNVGNFENNMYKPTH